VAAAVVAVAAMAVAADMAVAVAAVEIVAAVAATGKQLPDRFQTNSMGPRNLALRGPFHSARAFPCF